MHILAFIFLVLYMIFGDNKTKTRILLFFGIVFGWIWGLIAGLNWFKDHGGKDADFTFILHYFFWSVVILVFSVVRFIRNYDKRQAQEREAERVNREAEKAKWKADWQDKEKEKKKAREESEIELYLIEHDFDEYLRRYGENKDLSK